MKTIIKLSIQLSILFLSSCSSTSFIYRKYTTGVFLQPNKTLKHNTINVDTTKRYASLNHTIELINPAISLTTNNDKEIINRITNSIIKKDSVFHIKRKGKDIKYIKTCAGAPVFIVLEQKNNISHSHGRHSPKFKLKIAKIATYFALATFYIPAVGFFISMLAIRLIRIAKNKNPSYNDATLNIITSITTFISVLLLIALVLLSFYFFSAIFGLKLFSAFI